ncbi:MAG TPA: hypothetical protein DEP66_00405 [Acidimicrobiaceae bacterium]|nr:hypothetical protein [Acidimicrobiaceae bacterium]HCB36707.1 hypothetical protein [Acidimicrobiaceae bacterium]
MAAIFRRAMMYLGLGPDDAYEPVSDDYFSASEVGDAGDTVADQTVALVPSGAHLDASGAPTAPPMTPMPISGRARTGAGEAGVRTVQARDTWPHVIAPRVFDDAQQVGDRFQRSQPIILNLQDLDRDMARRLLDFTSGVCYALGGEMSKVANQVYLLVPAEVEFSDEHRRRITDSGFRP